MKLDFCGERVTRQLGSCQVKTNPTIREKPGIGQTLTNQPPFHILLVKHVQKNNCTKHTKKHTQYPGWGLTQPPTSELFLDVFLFDKIPYLLAI